MARKPDYLIIGTMKGGTTALNDFVCLHPEVARSTQKEIHYFSLYPHKGLDWYLEHFPEGGGSVIGEASPTYFDVAYTQAIPRLIQTLNPEMKIILIVRDPVGRAVSHFHHLRRVNKIQSMLNVDINEFFSRPCQDILRQTRELDFYLHQIVDFSLYARKFMTYRSVFPDENVLVVGAWDLKANARGTMNRVYSHLGLSEYYHPDFEKVKYSSGEGVAGLSQEVRESLNELFSEDFKTFCRASGLKYNAAEIFGS